MPMQAGVTPVPSNNVPQGHVIRLWVSGWSPSVAPMRMHSPERSPVCPIAGVGTRGHTGQEALRPTAVQCELPKWEQPTWELAKWERLKRGRDGRRQAYGGSFGRYIYVNMYECVCVYTCVCVCVFVCVCARAL